MPHRSSQSWADRAILIWNFDDAPEPLKNLSPHGGDEDFVIVVPPGLTLPPWITPWQEMSFHTLHDGSVVMIGCHA